jgi:hypothetical protein
VYTEEPRDLRAAHICRGPDNVQVRVPARDERKFAAEFEGIAETREYDFIKNIGEAETGVVVDGKSGDLEYGASFQSGMSTCAEVVRRAIFAHPPWKIKPQGPAPARTFGRYTVELPKEVNAFLEFAIGLRDGVDGRSDGAQFRVEIGGESVFDEVWAKSEWKSACLPLEKWRGQKVSVAFITTPGPRGNVSFDWACWGEPRVRFEVPPRRIDVSFACRREVGLVVGSDRGLKWRPARMQERLRVYDVNTEMPGRVVFLWDKPRPVKPPLDLRKEPFTVSISANGAPAAPGEPFVGASVSEVACGGQKRPAIGAHPPNHGRTSVDYLLELPAATPVKLAFAVGLRDGSKSDGVLFIVEANGRELFRRELTHADGWHPAEVDLSAYAGKPLLLSLVVDSDGPFYYDWASWAEPEMR